MTTMKEFNRNEEISDLFSMERMEPVAYWNKITDEFKKGEDNEEHEIIPEIIARIDEGNLLTREHYSAFIDGVLATKALDLGDQVPCIYQVQVAYCMAQIEQLGK